MHKYLNNFYISLSNIFKVRQKKQIQKYKKSEMKTTPRYEIIESVQDFECWDLKKLNFGSNPQKI